MNIVGIVVAALLVLVASGIWFFFGSEQPLPPATEIKSFSVAYAPSDSDSDHMELETKEFAVIDRDEIAALRNAIGDLRLARNPLIDSSRMDEGASWVINVYFKNEDYRFIPVDRKQVAGKMIKNSVLYQFLVENYT